MGTKAGGNVPLQNRVMPDGRIVVDPARGSFTGNRGILAFDDTGRLGARRWSHHAWIICTLEHPRGRYHGPQPQNAWTPLFFLDEAVALAAGHRPCGYCRRHAFDAFRTASGIDRAPQIDRALHRARVRRDRTQITHVALADTLPNWAFIRHEGAPWIVQGGFIRRFTPGGYRDRATRPRGEVTVLTPAPTVTALAGGYIPALHPSLSAP
ncbi:hypothetical protein RB2654_01430 [Rhodobacterales bacterium HTCC2654]|uniref:Uncharacterized protein n=1 Tax=Maritimibacter alkaliphilus HTCC2654 TaxID=314271 RepID=A3VIC3_9RHOB|nr:hypothetical protein RB2654_01430 [Rhodobacterales bacterium HTCC2654] [Maritimibacter alkaliphilus HTCC2654]